MADLRSADFLIGLRLRGAGCCLAQRTDDGAARKLDLEGVVLEALGVAQQEVRRAGKRRLDGGPPWAAGSPPGLCATPPSARRASLIVFPASSSTAATDTSAKA